MSWFNAIRPITRQIILPKHSAAPPTPGEQDAVIASFSRLSWSLEAEGLLKQAAATGEIRIGTSVGEPGWAAIQTGLPLVMVNELEDQKTFLFQQNRKTDK